MPIERKLSVAESYLRHLAAHGVEYLFGNGGTDFAPIAEAVARSEADGAQIPTPVTVPHENVAVGMAYGYAMVTGRPQAVMVHVGLGTANSINNIFNASRQRVPIFFTAGRTPILESGPLGSRNNFINWAQEMYDQAGMLRELVKWDYELRVPEQMQTVVDRGMAIARSEPQGPVYLMLPREVLAADAAPSDPQTRPMASATPPQADSQALEELARLVRAAESPLIITSDAGRTRRGFQALSSLAERLAIPVVEYRPRYACIPTAHPMHAGWDATALLPAADLVLVLESDVPWIPAQARPRSDAKVVQVGVDPLYARYPIRGFRTDLSIQAELGGALEALDASIGPLPEHEQQRRDARFARLVDAHGARRPAPAGPAMSAAWLSRCVDEIRDSETVLLNEYPLVLEQLNHRAPGEYYAQSPAGGLGWATGAALGVKLAQPDKTVVAVMGDGVYLFGNPTPTHMVSRMLDLPVLWVVYNNRRWAAVHRATLSLYPDGAAAQAADPPFASLEPATEFEKLVEACGGHGERVERPEDLPAALSRALHVMKTERRQALINFVADISYARTS